MAPEGSINDLTQETRRGVLGDQMSTLLPAMCIAFAAFCVWLTVRIINRRERWAMSVARITVAVGLFLVLFVMHYWPLMRIVISKTLQVN